MMKGISLHINTYDVEENEVLIDLLNASSSNSGSNITCGIRDGVFHYALFEMSKTSSNFLRMLEKFYILLYVCKLGLFFSFDQ